MGLGLRWGTWEELVLGGAVIRHGTDAWDAVAGELGARTASPNPFTPQECQAKYEDIQEQYSRCNAWFEELRKRRVAELKRELEKSDDSIGSLQSKLESLTSERETGSNFGFNTSQTESASPVEVADGIDSSSKEISRDGSSAGSFTEKSGRDWTHKCQNLASVLMPENNLKMQQSEDSSREKFGCGCLGIGFRIFKKKRGQRKRKGCNVVKEGSVGDSDMLSSAAFTNREGSEEGCIQDTKPPSEDCGGSWMGEDDVHLDLARIMDSIMKHKDVSVFRGRLESQKRARYKKMIRRHVDFHSISSRIGNGSISSAKELFRDLLILCNNSLVFYPKNSSEHNSALVLRDLVNKTLRWTFSSRNPTRSCSDDECAVPEKVGKPKKLRTALQHSISKNAPVAGKGDGVPLKENAPVAGKTDGTSLEENVVVAGKGTGTPLKDNAVVAGKGAGTPLKENAAVAGKGAGAPRKENAAVAGKGAGTSVKEKGNKGSRADIAVESRGRKRGIGRPVKVGQRGGRRRQESPNKGKKRARRA